MVNYLDIAYNPCLAISNTRKGNLEGSCCRSCRKDNRQIQCNSSNFH